MDTKKSTLVREYVLNQTEKSPENAQQKQAAFIKVLPSREREHPISQTNIRSDQIRSGDDDAETEKDEAATDRVKP